MAEKADRPTKRTRTHFSPAQMQAMENVFSVTQHPEGQQIATLAMDTALTVITIKTWFKNRRAKMQRQSQKDRVTVARDQLLGSNAFNTGPPNTSHHQHSAVHRGHRYHPYTHRASGSQQSAMLLQPPSHTAGGWEASLSSSQHLNTLTGLNASAPLWSGSNNSSNQHLSPSNKYWPNWLLNKQAAQPVQQNVASSQQNVASSQQNVESSQQNVVPSQLNHLCEVVILPELPSNTDIISIIALKSSNSQQNVTPSQLNHPSEDDIFLLELPTNPDIVSITAVKSHSIE